MSCMHARMHSERFEYIKKYLKMLLLSVLIHFIGIAFSSYEVYFSIQKGMCASLVIIYSMNQLLHLKMLTNKNMNNLPSMVPCK